MVLSLIIAAVLVTSGVSMCRLAVKLRQGRIPPNDIIGVRTKKAFASTDTWFDTQKAAAVPLGCMGVSYVDTGVIFIIQGIFSDVISILIPSCIVLVQSVVGITWIYYSSKELTRDNRVRD